MSVENVAGILKPLYIFHPMYGTFSSHVFYLAWLSCCVVFFQEKVNPEIRVLFQHFRRTYLGLVSETSELVLKRKLSGLYRRCVYVCLPKAIVPCVVG